ncbi:MAG TPA: hypothetical protein VFA94_13495 [Acidimicrobiales bacterium]|nr:hypothetical protein [Acidimicrobiales bacterium]
MTHAVFGAAPNVQIEDAARRHHRRREPAGVEGSAVQIQHREHLPGGEAARVVVAGLARFV